MTPHFYSNDDLHAEVAPLSAHERTWLRRLEQLLLACPSERLHLMTIGDAGLTAFDNEARLRHDLPIEDGGAERGGLALAEIKSKPQIHGVSG